MKIKKLSARKFRFYKNAISIFLFCAATALALPAQTVTLLASFDRVDGAHPSGSLVQAEDGYLYGTTQWGNDNWGTIFKISTVGTLTALDGIDGSYGAYPYAGLVEAPTGEFYGTTYTGGANSDSSCYYLGCGTVFTIPNGGPPATLYNFCSQKGCTDGANPSAGLIQANDSNFYGTTYGGGANAGCSLGCGTVFRITPAGRLTTLYSFCSQTGCTDGANPYAGLVQGSDGNFYGTTYTGGISGGGTVFKITPNGKLTTLHRFKGHDGANPHAELVEGADGYLYGTTLHGGENTSGCGPDSCGTVFKIGKGGSLSSLHSFNSTDSGLPYAGLVQATDGNFYGTASFDFGSIFEVTPSGSFTSLNVLYNGQSPYGTLLQATDGNLYGTTMLGGVNGNACFDGLGCGTVFSVSTGLGPFVKLLRAFGKVGQTGAILGQGLTGTTGVFLNGTPALFTVVSDSYIRATVPVGATTGFITVTTPSGTLTSNVVFNVR
jgi:uncharacterized repeat protein (TIGR03803 family)